MKSKYPWLVEGNYAFYSYKGLFNDEYNMYNYNVCKVLKIENEDKILIEDHILTNYCQYAKLGNVELECQDNPPTYYVKASELAPLKFVEYTYEQAKKYLLGALLEYTVTNPTFPSYAGRHTELITDVSEQIETMTCLENPSEVVDTRTAVYINGKNQSKYMYNNTMICNLPFGWPKLIRYK